MLVADDFNDTTRFFSKTMPKNTNFIFSFVDSEGYSGGFLSKDGKFDSGAEQVDFPLFYDTLGAWASQKATPFALRHVLKKLRAYMTADLMEFPDYKGELDIFPVDDLDKAHAFILEDILTGKHTKTTKERLPFADAMVGLWLFLHFSFTKS